MDVAPLLGRALKVMRIFRITAALLHRT